ncbi:MAG: methyltransferase domain-containing protein [Pseudomonas sp.]|uniref:class I SAM-dependent methyltransferase n=1 Tax=Pseudomonas sp. TaxID=306 RepID=UPI00299D85E7|nr:methyltransferase domain-containing protein [Pseudomonas sp.]MDX1722558.1 methyltransferase domain-containing protein [Pseudomonas sp.]
MSENAFFSDYPRFYATSQTSAIPDRLNCRYQSIIQANQNIIAGKRLLDIGSHDGRWTFAALQAGAQHVTGIEPRAELIDNAVSNMQAYGIDESSYAFIKDDVFNFLRSHTNEIDVVLCLGYFYHTIQHVELVKLMAGTQARHIILDTEVFPTNTPYHSSPTPRQLKERSAREDNFVIQLIKDPVAQEMMATEDAFTEDGMTIVGRPSVGAIHFIFEHFGFEVQEIDWDTLLAQSAEGLNDYQEGWRKTFLCSRK